MNLVFGLFIVAVIGAGVVFALKSHTKRSPNVPPTAGGHSSGSEEPRKGPALDTKKSAQ